MISRLRVTSAAACLAALILVLFLAGDEIGQQSAEVIQEGTAEVIPCPSGNAELCNKAANKALAVKKGVNDAAAKVSFVTTTKKMEDRLDHVEHILASNTHAAPRGKLDEKHHLSQTRKSFTALLKHLKTSAAHKAQMAAHTVSHFVRHHIVGLATLAARTTDSTSKEQQKTVDAAAKLKRNLAADMRLASTIKSKSQKRAHKAILATHAAANHVLSAKLQKSMKQVQKLKKQRSKLMQLSRSETLLMKKQAHTLQGRLVANDRAAQKLLAIAKAKHAKQVQELRQGMKRLTSIYRAQVLKAQREATLAKQAAAKAMSKAASMEKKHKAAQKRADYNARLSHATAKLEQNEARAAKIELVKSQAQQAAAKKAASAAQKAELKSRAEHQRLKLAIKKSEELAKVSASRLEATKMKLNTLRKKFQAQRQRRKELVKRSTKSARNAKEALHKAEVKAAKNTQTALAELHRKMNLEKKNIQEHEALKAKTAAARALKDTKKLLAEEHRKMALEKKRMQEFLALKIDETKRQTAISAAKAMEEQIQADHIKQAKLIAKFTGVVPTNLGDAAKAAAKKVQAKRVAVLKAAENPTLVQTKLSYLGCFSDRGSDRDLPHLMPLETTIPSKCFAMCQAANPKWKFAALQNGKQCFCGASYGRHGREPGATCFLQCRGTNSRCGGVMRNSVYVAQP